MAVYMTRRTIRHILHSHVYTMHYARVDNFMDDAMAFDGPRRDQSEITAYVKAEAPPPRSLRSRGFGVEWVAH